jgi:hypothetical protein
MAEARGGPTMVPKFPVSVVPRAKIRVTGAQTPFSTSEAVFCAAAGRSEYANLKRGRIWRSLTCELSREEGEKGQESCCIFRHDEHVKI